MEDPYSVLGISKDAPDTVVDAAYRALVKEKHPDNGGDPDEFKIVNEAYEKIKSNESGNSSKNKSKPNWFGGMFDIEGFEPVETVSVVGDPDEGLTVEGKAFTVSLLGIVPHANVWRLVRLPEQMDGEHRTLVLFKMQNTTDDVHQWNSKNTQYIDTDGFTYDSEMSTFIDRDNLQPRWTCVTAELDAHAKTYFIDMVEKMPSDAQISKVVHRQKTFDEGRIDGLVKDEERYEFNVQKESRIPIELE